MANRRGKRSIRFRVEDENRLTERVTKSYLFRFEDEFIESLYDNIQLIKKDEVKFDISIGIEHLDMDNTEKEYWNYSNPILGSWAYSNDINKSEFIEGIKEWLTHWNGMGVRYYEIGFIEKVSNEKLNENDNYWNVEY